MKQSNNFLHLLLFVVGYFIYVTYSAFFIDIVIAILMAISLGKFELYLYNKFKNKYISATIVTLFFMAFLLLPILYFIFEVAGVISHLSIETIQTTLEKTKSLLNYFPDVIKEKILSFMSSENITSTYKTMLVYTGKLTASSLLFLKDTFLIMVFFFFINLYGSELTQFFKSVVPLEESKSKQLFQETSEVMSLVFYSIFLTAILEGVLFGFIVYIYGFSPLFWTIMYAFASLIPVIGGAMMWIPVSLFLYAKGDATGAMAVAIYSIVVISIFADTFVKPVIINKLKVILKNSIELNSMLIFFSIIAGLSSFGFWGMLLGPAITTLFISILKFYKKIT